MSKPDMWNVDLVLQGKKIMKISRANNYQNRYLGLVVHKKMDFEDDVRNTIVAG